MTIALVPPGINTIPSLTICLVIGGAGWLQNFSKSSPLTPASVSDLPKSSVQALEMSTARAVHGDPAR
jgi:hypothetical protein